ncbi:MAG: DUF5123 domain-containing protein [Bacteroidota bacterium]|nr:DUF5123 domain-containing protein [Bacteroidota bacterium]
MKTKIISKHIFFWLIAIAIFMGACTKNPVENPLIRLFEPVVSTSPQVQGNQITFSWLKITGTASYKVDISRDTTFKTIDQTVKVSKDTNYVVFSNLLWDTGYRIRLRGIASDTTKNSKYVKVDVKTGKFPTILIAPTSNDLTDYSIVVRWNNTGATATSINVLKTNGTLVKTVALTSTDITNGYKEIQGLAGTTTYVVSIYSGTTLRGTQNYTTTASPNFGNAAVIDLRSITGRPTLLTDTMATAPSGAVYILRRNEIYTCNSAAAVTLTKSIKVICLPGLGSPAFLNYLNETDVSGAIDSIKFLNVSISGLKTDGISKVSYMFNTTSSNSCNIGIVSFENCTIKSFGNAIVRLQTGAAPWGIINKVLVKSCVINDIGIASGYGIFHAANGSANGNKINDFEMQSTTCYNFSKGVLVNSMANSASALVNNCTFNDFITSGNYFMDFGTYTVTSVNINNSIFGKTKDAALSRGVRASTSTTVNTNNCYNTSDFVTAANPIPGLNAFSGLSTDLWTDPANGVFTFKATSFAGKTSSGDPRWR